MNNQFDMLAKVALNEASLGDYVKAASRAAVHGAARAVQTAAKIADFAAKDSGMPYSGSYGRVADTAGKVVQKMKDLGASATEEALMKKLYGDNPKKGDNVNVKLPGITAPSARITKVSAGAKDDTLYTVDLFPVNPHIINEPEQQATLNAKKQSPVDQVIFTKGNGDYGSTNTRLSFYKDGKLVAARNIPGLKEQGGIHFNGSGQPWALNLDSSDSIDFNSITAFIANDPNLKLNAGTIKNVLGSTNYPYLKKALAQAGVNDSQYQQALSKAINAIKQGQPAPTPKTPVSIKKTKPKNKTNNKKPSTKAPVKPASTKPPAVQPPVPITKRTTQTKAGTPVATPTAADLASMNLPQHPLGSR